MWHLCIQVASFQVQNGKFFILEHPAGASSWQTHALRWLLDQPGVLRFLLDQCSLGLQACEKGVSLKPTAIATNHVGVAFHFHSTSAARTISMLG